jgi:hypothetical protein
MYDEFFEIGLDILVRCVAGRNLERDCEQTDLAKAQVG